MKKVITYLLTVILLLVSVPVFAIVSSSPEIPVAVEIDYENMTFKLEVVLEDNNPHKGMLTVTKPDAVGAEQTLTDEDDTPEEVKAKLYLVANQEMKGAGTLSFVVPINDTAIAGVYGFRLGVTGINGSESVNVYKGIKNYADSTLRKTVFDLFNDDNPDVHGLLSTYGKGAEQEILNCDISSNNLIYTNYQSDVDAFVKSIRHEEGVSFANCLDVEKVFNASIALVNLNKNTIDASNLVTGVDDLYITKNKYFAGDVIGDTAKRLQSFKMSNGGDFDSLTEFKKEFDEAFFLSAVSSASRDDITELVNGYPALSALGVNYGDALPSEVNKALTNVVYETIEQFVNAFNDSKVEVLTRDNPTHRGDSGVGGSVGFGLGGSSSGTAIIPPSYVDDEKVFNDIDSVPWAHDAILYLSEHGVNGKADGIFAPNDILNREEGVKMLVCALNVEVDGKIAPFNDVSIGDWFYPYVAGAYEAKLINGIGNDLFGVGRIFTREDFSVMLYSIAGEYATNSKDIGMYTDNYLIADYAKNAIAHLSGHEIINGMGDGSFSPKAPITRAQAAKMIYGVVNLLNGGNGI